MTSLWVEPFLTFQVVCHNSQQQNTNTALVFTQGMRDILDDLTFDYDVFEKLLFDLDDNYEIIKTEYITVNDLELKSIVDQLMTQMIKLQMEISDKLVDFKHTNRA